MSRFIHIFCQADKPIPAKELIDFVEEGAYFDDPPKAIVVPDSALKGDALWTEIQVEYQARKRPVILSRETLPKKFLGEVAEACEALETAGLAKTQAALILRLKATRQLIVFEIDSQGATEECWEMLDNLEAWIAQERSGLVYVPSEGFYDAELKPLCKLPPR